MRQLKSPWVATGADPIDSDRHAGDRSQVVYAVACGLVRAGLPDDLIVAALINQDNLISAHVHDQKGNKATRPEDRNTRGFHAVLVNAADEAAARTSANASIYVPKGVPNSWTALDLSSTSDGEAIWLATR